MQRDADDKRFEEALARLRPDREAMPWTARIELAAALGRSLENGGPTPVRLELVELLCADPQAHVRREMAEHLLHLPESHFLRLAGKLTADPSSFVHQAAKYALDRHQKGAKEEERRRRAANDASAAMGAFEERYGKPAARDARRLADKQFAILVRGTAHDIWNILDPLEDELSRALAALSGLGQQRELKPCREAIQRAAGQAEFLGRFIRDMEEYGKAGPAKRQRERIGDIIRDAVEKVAQGRKGRNPRAVTFDLSAVSEMLVAEVARHQIHSCILNLLWNAWESFDDYGPHQPKRISVSAAAIRGNAEVVVADNGCGICAEDLSTVREFNLGTTSKDYGTGFGLPTVNAYAQAHGGRVEIQSAPGQGTVVKLILPLEAEEDGE